MWTDVQSGMERFLRWRLIGLLELMGADAFFNTAIGKLNMRVRLTGGMASKAPIDDNHLAGLTHSFLSEG